jgi:hypothetical protein
MTFKLFGFSKGHREQENHGYIRIQEIERPNNLKVIETKKTKEPKRGRRQID